MNIYLLVSNNINAEPSSRHVKSGTELNYRKIIFARLPSIVLARKLVCMCMYVCMWWGRIIDKRIWFHLRNSINKVQCCQATQINFTLGKFYQSIIKAHFPVYEWRVTIRKRLTFMESNFFFQREQRTRCAETEMIARQSFRSISMKKKKNNKINARSLRRDAMIVL